GLRRTIEGGGHRIAPLLLFGENISLLPHLVSHCHTLRSCRAHEEQVSVASIKGHGVTLTLTFPRAVEPPPGSARTRFGPCLPEAAKLVPVIAPGAKQGGNCAPSEGTAQSFRLSAWHSFCFLEDVAENNVASPYSFPTREDHLT